MILVDKSSKQLDVTVIGTKPTLILTDPKGQAYMAEIEDSKSVLNIKNPVAGKWTLSAGDTSTFTTEIGILYEVPLDYGFSVQKPTSLEETEKNPIKGMTLFAIL
jgi:hypothetical protein